MSKDYVFKNKDGKLEFVGDFEGLYCDQEDPWNQSGRTGEIKDYYDNSRKRLEDLLKISNPESILEVGCGLGYTTNIIQRCVPNCKVVGLDISETAVKKAKFLFPDLDFLSGNIMSPSIETTIKYDVVILNQLLWYILEDLEIVFSNCRDLLHPDGKIIISQAFLKTPQDQKYGREICDGFEGLMNYIRKNLKDKFEIDYYNYDNSKNLLHNDGLISLEKLS